MDFIILLILTLGFLLISFIKDKGKTGKALKIAIKNCIKISAPIILMVLIISITLVFLPAELISKYLGNENKLAAIGSASLIGSIALLPGFIAFPLSGILLQNGVSYMVISSFTSTLMMVGILTIPVERQYLGLRVSILRNTIALLTALIIAVVTGLLYGEII
ncbi:MAG: hypothetical protein GY760_27070 [Deltaproteobacteria bacterium]|nr:hypothetical protein [Deltaproteobacteria bacterium]